MTKGEPSVKLKNLTLHTYIHTFIDHFPKGAFQCQLLSTFILNFLPTMKTLKM